ncbi:MAG: class II fumarate hydratase [Dehalococcoidia bacterium]|nr:class II fumarate hydratase [Dehalococcoidia bacterium]MDP6227286.1 class II fumarate hydratase [Dehalococcoidia bacterium]MDP7083565.1 class II fumarate hydratase [Dehalococcoidia bacterium]MDP7199341.1 class II fumarate hydratase [Dehalococcoidia bacterium]MDP7510063.1 class II fumarate hydratase [Dehalococcoidia bacterium]
MTTGDNKVRIERDSMGPMEVPAGALYGASTMRAVLNFPISDLRFPRSFIRSLGLVKLAAAKTNMALGLLAVKEGNAVVAAAQEVADGKLDEHFVLDVFQTGSGTSTNTNANEVIANRASQILGGDLGSGLVHPNDHVNMGQSSNDVIPTCIHLAALMAATEDLVPALEKLEGALRKKSEELWLVIKTGRTHLQDATPVRLGQEFLGFAGQAGYSIQRLGRMTDALAEVALGGTAVGTGVNTHPEFSARTCRLLSEITGVQVRETDNHFQAQAALDGVVEASGILKTIAISLHKMANDIRFLACGPRAGLGEILVPEVQPGSSIMPGKVNPVISESVIQVVAQVVGNDATVTLAGQGGYFELNTMMPVAAYNILQSISLLAASADNFAEQCVKGIQATETGPQMVEKGLMLGTALTPAIGYDAAATIAKEAAATGSTIREMAKLKTSLSDAELDNLLNPAAMTEPGLGSGVGGGG